MGAFIAIKNTAHMLIPACSGTWQGYVLMSTVQTRVLTKH